MIAAPVLAEPERYQVDTKRSEVVALVYREGIAAGAAHDHAIRATVLEGSLMFDPAHLEHSRAEITANVAAFRIDEPAMRKKYHMRGDINDEDKREVDANMRSADQLNAQRFKTAKFVVDSLKISKRPNLYELRGRLWIRGIWRVMKAPITITRKPGRLLAQGSLSFNQTDFGIEPYSAALGFVKVANRVVLRFSLVANLPPSTKAAN